MVVEEVPVVVTVPVAVPLVPEDAEPDPEDVAPVPEVEAPVPEGAVPEVAEDEVLDPAFVPDCPAVKDVELDIVALPDPEETPAGSVLDRADVVVVDAEPDTASAPNAPAVEVVEEVYTAPEEVAGIDELAKYIDEYDPRTTEAVKLEVVLDNGVVVDPKAEVRLELDESEPVAAGSAPLLMLPVESVLEEEPYCDEEVAEPLLARPVVEVDVDAVAVPLPLAEVELDEPVKAGSGALFALPLESEVDEAPETDEVVVELVPEADGLVIVVPLMLADIELAAAGSSVDEAPLLVESEVEVEPDIELVEDVVVPPVEADVVVEVEEVTTVPVVAVATPVPLLLDPEPEVTTSGDAAPPALLLEEVDVAPLPVEMGVPLVVGAGESDDESSVAE